MEVHNIFRLHIVVQKIFKNAFASCFVIHQQTIFPDHKKKLKELIKEDSFHSIAKKVQQVSQTRSSKGPCVN